MHLQREALWARVDGLVPAGASTGEGEQDAVNHSDQYSGRALMALDLKRQTGGQEQGVVSHAGQPALKQRMGLFTTCIGRARYSGRALMALCLEGQARGQEQDAVSQGRPASAEARSEPVRHLHRQCEVLKAHVDGLVPGGTLLGGFP